VWVRFVRVSYEPLQTASVTTQCPRCAAYSSIDVTFSQVVQTTAFARTETRRVAGAARCRICDAEIPRRLWTHEIKAFFDATKATAPVAYRRTRQIDKSLLRVFLLSTILPLLILVVAVAAIGLATRHQHQREQSIDELLRSPRVNDRIVVSSTCDGALANYLYKVVAVDDSTVTAVASTQTNVNAVGHVKDFASDDGLFTGAQARVKRTRIASPDRDWVSAEPASSAQPICAAIRDASRP